MLIKKSFSVIVCVLNNYEGLVECIDSILGQSVKPNEVIVVHAGTGENVPSYINALNKESICFKYFYSDKSLIKQRTLGMNKSIGDVLFFVDDDATLHKDFFEKIMTIYEKQWDDNLGGIQGTIQSHKMYKNHVNNILRRLFCLNVVKGNGKLQVSGYPSYLAYSKDITEVEVFNGCMMSFKREVLLSENFNPYFVKNWWGDDFELSYRISRNYKLFQVPDAIVYHEVSSIKNEGLKRFWYMKTVNRSYIFKKYFSNNPLYYAVYFWSTIGDILTMFSQSIKSRTFMPIVGWYNGIVFNVKNNFKIQQ